MAPAPVLSRPRRAVGGSTAGRPPPLAASPPVAPSTGPALDSPARTAHGSGTATARRPRVCRGAFSHSIPIYVYTYGCIYQLTCLFVNVYTLRNMSVNMFIHMSANVAMCGEGRGRGYLPKGRRRLAHTLRQRGRGWPPQPRRLYRQGTRRNRIRGLAAGHRITRRRPCARALTHHITCPPRIMSRFRCRLTISFCAIICWFIARRTIRKSACLRTGADRGRRRPFVRAAAAAAAFVSFARAVAAAAGVADEGEQLRELIQRDIFAFFFSFWFRGVF